MEPNPPTVTLTKKTMTLQKQPKIINETFMGFCISPALGTYFYPFAQIHVIQTSRLHQAQILQ